MPGPRRTYVLDTSVLLADPRSPLRFDEHDVVVPVVALLELDAKRNHPELGWNARQALNVLEDLRQHHGGLGELMPTGRGGTLRIEVNHVDVDLPAAMATGGHDHRVLAVAAALRGDGGDVVLVSKDLPLRLKAGVLGLEAEEYRNEAASTTAVGPGWTELEVEGWVVDELFRCGVVDLAEARDLTCHTGLILHAGSQSGLGRVQADKRVHLVREQVVFDVRARSAEQRLALDLLTDPSIGIVSLGGPAGTGKSVLALAAGLDAVLEQRTHNRVIVFRPIFPVGGQDLGYLPGSEAEKMLPWGAAVTDALEAIAGQEVIDEVFGRGLLEVLLLTHIRGRSLTDSFVVIDEAQNLERTVLLTALSRLGQGSRVVLTHDIAQRDNLRVGRHDGVASVIDTLKGHPLFGHVALTRAERSPVAALVTQVLDGRAVR
jgi:PhoH-like ATPase